MYSFFWKKTKNWTFWKFLLFPSHSTAKLLLWANWEKIRFFLNKSIYFFSKQPKSSTFWELLLSQSVSTAKSLPLPSSGFKSNQYFVSKNPCISWKRTKLRNFWEILLSQSHFAANLLHLSIMKNIRIFRWKIHLLFFEQTQILQVLRIFTISVAIYSKSSTFHFWRFWKKLISLKKTEYLYILRNFNIFSRKTHLFFLKETQTLHVLRNFTGSVALYSKISTFKIQRFQKPSLYCLGKPIYLLKNPNFDCFQILRYFSRILHQNCYL